MIKITKNQLVKNYDFRNYQDKNDSILFPKYQIQFRLVLRNNNLDSEILDGNFDRLKEIIIGANKRNTRFRLKINNTRIKDDIISIYYFWSDDKTLIEYIKGVVWFWNY